MKKNVFRCMILAALLTGLTGCQKSDNDSEWKKEDKLLEDEQTEATSQDEMTSESQEDEDTTSTDVEASVGMEMNQLDLSGYTFHNDEALNEVIKYTNENIVDDLLDGGQHSSPIFRTVLRGSECLRNQVFWAFFFGKLDDFVGFPRGSRGVFTHFFTV